MTLLPTLLGLAGGTAGGLLFALLGLPAPWLTGPMAGAAVLLAAGAPVAVPAGLRTVAFALVGCGMGAALSPETVRQMAAWPLTLAVLAASVVTTIAAVSWHLRRAHGWDAATARYTAIPGALTATLVLAAASTADVPRVAFAQTLRLVVLVAVIPLVVGSAADPVARASPAASPADPTGLLLLSAATLAGIGIVHLARIPAPALVGGLVGSSIAHAAGWVTVTVPQPLLLAAFVVSGVAIGERFKGTRMAVLTTSLRAAVESVVLAILISLAFAWAGSALAGLPFGQVWLALAPGGLEAMAILAFLLDLDPAFVGAHHVARFVALSLLVPLWLRPRQAARADRRGP
jgi:hypothetical protein